MINNEIWKEIKNFPDYMISSYGNVMSLNYRRTHKKHLLKQSTNNYGYKVVCLYNNKENKRISVHRLVAQTFIPNPNNKLEINHIDCNPSNNRVDNLEWCTHKENTDYRDLKKPKTWVSNKHLTKEEVNIIKKERQLGKYYKEVWKQYSNKITLSGFEKVWYGQNWN